MRLPTRLNGLERAFSDVTVHRWRWDWNCPGGSPERRWQPADANQKDAVTP